MNLDQRLKKITELSQLKPLPPSGETAFAELKPIMDGLKFVRNTVVHSVVVEHDDEGHVFENRSKGHKLTKAEIFSTEDLKNYASHLVYKLRFSLGLKDGNLFQYEPPARPEIPAFLRSRISLPKTK